MYSQYTKDQVKSFVGQFGNMIIAAITDKGLYFPAVVGQLTVESKWGTSGLSTTYNNYGGVKATGSDFSNGSVSMDTTEVVGGQTIPMQQPFATYADFQSFMNDYVRVLALPNYVAAGVYAATSPYDQILAIGKGGYSTNNPQAYLDECKGRIDACLDQFTWGKIVSTAPAPDAPVGNVWANALQSIFGTINATLGPAGAGAIGGTTSN